MSKKILITESQYKKLLIKLSNQHDVVEEGWKENLLAGITLLAQSLGSAAPLINKTVSNLPKEDKLELVNIAKRGGSPREIANYVSNKGNFKQERTKVYTQTVVDSVENEINQAFQANMVTPNQQVLQNTIDSAIDSLKSKLGTEDIDNQDIRIEIEASASSIPATNVLPQGVTQADHDYGRGVADWVSDKSQGYDVIQGGNAFLAQERANRTQQALQDMGYEDVEITNVNPNGGDDESAQFVKVKVFVKGETTEQPTEQFAWEPVSFHKDNRPGLLGATFHYKSPAGKTLHGADLSTWLDFMKREGMINSDITAEDLTNIILELPKGSTSGGELYKIIKEKLPEAIPPFHYKLTNQKVGYSFN